MLELIATLALVGFACVFAAKLVETVCGEIVIRVRGRRV